MLSNMWERGGRPGDDVMQDIFNRRSLTSRVCSSDDVAEFCTGVRTHVTESVIN